MNRHIRKIKTCIIKDKVATIKVNEYALIKKDEIE